MITITSDQPEIQLISSYHDPDSIVFYDFMWKPDIWVANKVYTKGSLVIPTVDTGFIYKVLSPGKSAPVAEPTWGTTENSKTIDNTITWLAIPYNAYLLPTQSINTAVATVDGGVTLGSGAYDLTITEGTVRIWVVAVPATIQYFTLSCKITTGDIPPIVEEKSIIIPVVST